MTEPRKLRQTSELMTMMGLTGAVVREGFAVGGPVADAMASASVSRPIDLLRISKTFQTVFKIHRYPASFHVDRWFFPNIFQQTSHSQNSLAVTFQCPPWLNRQILWSRQGIRSWTCKSRVATIVALRFTRCFTAWAWLLSSPDQIAGASWRSSGPMWRVRNFRSLPRIHMPTPALTMILCQSCTLESLPLVPRAKKPLWWKMPAITSTPAIRMNIIYMSLANETWWPKMMSFNWRRCTVAPARPAVASDPLSHQPPKREHLGRIIGEPLWTPVES